MRGDDAEEHKTLAHADELTSEYLHARNSHFRILKSYYAYGIALRTILTAGLLIAGTLFVVSRQMTLGQFVAAEVLIVMISSSIEKLMTSINTIFDVLTAVEKVAAVTDLPMDEHKNTIAFENA